jgi:uncharacterized HAD superfamily protein
MSTFSNGLSPINITSKHMYHLHTTKIVMIVHEGLQDVREWQQGVRRKGELLRDAVAMAIASAHSMRELHCIFVKSDK